MDYFNDILYQLEQIDDRIKYETYMQMFRGNKKMAMEAVYREKEEEREEMRVKLMKSRQQRQYVAHQLLSEKAERIRRNSTSRDQISQIDELISVLDRLRV